MHPVSGAALVRCSQPRSGIKQLRSEDDEFFFREMIRRNPGGQKLVIYDARPFLNAAWNRGIKYCVYCVCCFWLCVWVWMVAMVR